MAYEIKVTLSLKKQPNDELVYFKVDGGRFENARTLKLNVNSKYILEFTIRPALVVDCLNVFGGNIEMEKTEQDDLKSVYSGEWMATGFDIDKRGKRHNVPIILEIRDHGTLKTNLQCKFYSENDSNHAHWGTMVSYIEFDCRRKEGSTYIDVVKETYR